jgi:hypothetical protein
MRTRPPRLALALALLAVGACRPSWKYNEQVEGTVKLDGAPVANALVRFVPEDPNVQRPASSGYTDEKGRFTLACENGKPGAVLAKHNVLVLAGRGGEDAPARRVNIPPVYSNPVATPLQVEVTADKHSYDLALSRNPPKR